MTEINDLSQVDALASGDQFPIWNAAAGSTRRVSADQIMAFLAPYSGRPDIVRNSPSATGFTITLDGQQDIRIIATPLGSYADGALVLPASPLDGQNVVFSSSRAITVFTVSAAVTVANAPTSIGTNGYFTMQYDAVAATWRRIA